jgi:ubiquitin-like modifier-activating enzyme ATG7
MLVSAAVVELLVSILHHPLGIAAPRPSTIHEGGAAAAGNDEPEPVPTAGSCLGAVPHQVRGMLAEFGQMTLDGQAFDKCTGCSPAIVAAYEKSLPELLIGACNIPNYLEDLSGLSALHDTVDELEDWDNDEDDF